MFTKNDIKPGMVVELRNGDRAFIGVRYDNTEQYVLDYLDDMRCLFLSNYGVNMCYKENVKESQFDIMKVYGYSRLGFDTTLLNNLDKRKLLYTRENQENNEVEKLATLIKENASEIAKLILKNSN